MGESVSGRGNALIRLRELPAIYRQSYTGLAVTTPPPERRRVALGFANLLVDEDHPRLCNEHSDQTVKSEEQQVQIDGFIKIFLDLSNRPHLSDSVDPFGFLMLGTPHLPPDFGDVPFTDDHPGRAVYRFFKYNVAPKRTLIEKDNMYLRAICAMAMDNEMVKSAMLVLPPTYILDFFDHPQLKTAARNYHRITVGLLHKAKIHFETTDPSNWREEEVTALLIVVVLLMHNHEVNWQAQAPRDKNPAWYRYGRLAWDVLRDSDPRYRYRDPAAVQVRETWYGAGQIICLDLAFSDAFFPLDLDLSNSPPSWLCYGNEHERRKIFGMNGLSPQLMHYYLNITFLSALLHEQTDSSDARAPIVMLEETLLKLRALKQWSDISKGGTVEEIMRVNDDDLPSLEPHVTDLIGACYVEAALIYVQVRGLRRPRGHTEVQMSLKRLLFMIRWQPTRGYLFTAQTPLFAVFMAGVVAIFPEDRQVVKEWFKKTMDDSRGNVKPLWNVMLALWHWQDTSANFGETQANDPFDAHAWWENMVTMLVDQFGRLNLA
jgi:hypothetical protein